MTGKEILARLNEYFDSIEDFAYDEFDDNQLNLGTVKTVCQKGGEAEGSEWYVVHHFVDHDVYIKTEGYYSSFHGTDFDYGIGEEVRPKEKTVTVYE